MGKSARDHHEKAQLARSIPCPHTTAQTLDTSLPVFPVQKFSAREHCICASLEVLEEDLPAQTMSNSIMACPSRQQRKAAWLLCPSARC